MEVMSVSGSKHRAAPTSFAPNFVHQANQYRTPNTAAQAHWIKKLFAMQPGSPEYMTKAPAILDALRDSSEGSVNLLMCASHLKKCVNKLGRIPLHSLVHCGVPQPAFAAFKRKYPHLYRPATGVHESIITFLEETYSEGDPNGLRFGRPVSIRFSTTDSRNPAMQERDEQEHIWD